MSEIKTIIETLPLKSNTEQKNNHYIPVWEYAGEILKKYDLERNGISNGMENYSMLCLNG